MTTVSDEHLQRAFAIARRPDWPATLHELLEHARHASLVQGLAQRLAKGQGTASPDDAVPPPPPLRSSDFSPRHNSPRANGQTERRRRDAHAPAVDFKSLAAGERDDD